MHVRGKSNCACVLAIHVTKRSVEQTSGGPPGEETIELNRKEQDLKLIEVTQNNLSEKKGNL